MTNVNWKKIKADAIKTLKNNKTLDISEICYSDKHKDGLDIFFIQNVVFGVARRGIDSFIIIHDLHCYIDILEDRIRIHLY